MMCNTGVYLFYNSVQLVEIHDTASGHRTAINRANTVDDEEPYQLYDVEMWWR